MPTSFLLIEDYFASGDDRYVEAIRDFHVAGSLATIADKWKKDPRPWARRQIFRYLDVPLDAPAHETVVKRLFKHAQELKDDELMGAFAVAFDRLVVPQIRQLPVGRPKGLLFAHCTRYYYLRRRAWR